MMKQFEAYYYGDDDESEPIRVKQRDRAEKAPKIMFARWGGMNPKRDKEKEKKFHKPDDPIFGPKDEPRFHDAPEHRGIYAYIWPYIEPFLAAWNKKMMIQTGKDEFGDPEYKFPPIKKFQHYGDIWCHFVDEAKKFDVGKEYWGSWVKVDTKDLPMLLGKVIARDIKQIKQPNAWEPKGYKDPVRDPYKIGRSGILTMNRDHLEVFIPGKVRETR